MGVQKYTSLIKMHLQVQNFFVLCFCCEDFLDVSVLYTVIQGSTLSLSNCPNPLCVDATCSSKENGSAATICGKTVFKDAVSREMVVTSNLILPKKKRLALVK
jgi:hypothetical protein